MVAARACFVSHSRRRYSNNRRETEVEEAGGTLLDLKLETEEGGHGLSVQRASEGGKGEVIHFYPELPEGIRAPSTLISPQ